MPMQETERQAVAKAADSRQHLKTLQLVWLGKSENRETVGMVRAEGNFGNSPQHQMVPYAVVQSPLW